VVERSKKGFYDTITEAVRYFSEHGFVSAERLEFWVRELRLAAERSMIPTYVMEEQLRATFGSIYRRMVERGGIAKYHPGIGHFTLQQVQPRLRAELDRRILSSSQLIKLNRVEAIEKTIRRFSGWATSIPAGGSDVVDKRETKDDVRKALASLPFVERRCNIDQGHKFIANLNSILATDGGAIAGRWVDRGTSDAHYKARPQHKAWSDRKAVFLIRDSWAHRAGLVKPNDDGFTDDHEAPGELVYCACSLVFLYNLRQLPPDMLTAKGKEALERAKVA